MQIILTETGKRFNKEWVFRNLTFTFESKGSYAILGKNGSGKSTLLQIIAGNITATSGKVSYHLDGEEISSSEIFEHIAIVAPYLELIEEFTLREMVEFHFRFKPMIAGQTVKTITELEGLEGAGKAPIRTFSSGMKQRVKLLLAGMSDVPLLLLDEPLMNLDQAGTDWFIEMLTKVKGKRTVVICSNNQEEEIGLCSEKIFIGHYKR